MSKAGWEFFVLSPCYAVHWGFQSKEDRPAWRERQNNVNSLKFAAFARELKTKYGVKTTLSGAKDRKRKMRALQKRISEVAEKNAAAESVAEE